MAALFICLKEPVHCVAGGAHKCFYVFAALFLRSCLAMSARISDTACCCRTAALFAIIIQMSFLSVDIGKSIPISQHHGIIPNFNERDQIVT